MKKTWLIAILAAIFVSAIIAVGLNGSCPRGCRPDMRRVSDLRQIQIALEYYARLCGVYPGGAPKPGSDPSCASVTTPAQLTPRFLNRDLSYIPKDDPTGADYSYCYTMNGASYLLQAKLIYSSNRALTNSLAAPPANCTNTVGTVTCDKSKGEYCVGPSRD